MSVRRAAILIAALVTAGCGGTTAALQPPQQSTALHAAVFDSTGSWMAPSAQGQDLLYVSDVFGKVSVFSYPAMKRVGLLKGFMSTAGLCTDPSTGDVYVVDTNAVALFKYKHGGTKPVKELHLFGYFPFACAVNPTTGDVAVADIAKQPSGPGAVSIFRKGALFPTTLSDPSFDAYYFCSYDNKGNIFFDGADVNSNQTEFAELPSGSSSFKAITLDKVIGYPGGVQWDGTDVAVQDTMSRILYRFKITGSHGKSVGSTRFEADRSTLVHQFWIQGNTIAMPYGAAPRSVRLVGRWPFPGGGSPAKSLTIERAAELVGVTVSPAN
jgi:hypothetical protein